MSQDSSFDINAIRLDDIIITKAGIENPDTIASIDKEKHTFDISYDFIPGVNVSQKRARIVFSCQIKANNEDGKPLNVSGTFDVVFYFSVDNIDKLSKVEGEDLIMNGDLVSALANIAYSTSRGIIYTRCQGTVLKSFVLPILPNEELQKILGVNAG